MAFAVRREVERFDRRDPSPEVVAASRDEFVGVARSFWLIPELIPPATRNDVGLLYAFCRHLDDAIDEEPDPARARAAWQRWHDEVHGRIEAQPLVAAFVDAAERNAIPIAWIDLLFDGMKLDLDGLRIADDDDLLRYAYRVSSIVGLMLGQIFGMPDRRTQHWVVDLGLALQITNVLLGVASDAARGRVYLPACRLEAVGLSPDAVLDDPQRPGLRPVLAGLAALADDLYLDAERAAVLWPLRYRHGIVLLGRAYRELGWRAARGEPAPAMPDALPLRERLHHLGVLLRHLAPPQGLGFRPAPPHDPTHHRALDPSWPGVHGAGSVRYGRPR